MATIITAQGYDINTDRSPVTLCTKQFAERMGLQIIAGSEQTVPDTDVDYDGRYRPGGGS